MHSFSSTQAGTSLKESHSTGHLMSSTAQLMDAKNMIDRYDALLEMKNIDIDKKRDVLIKSFNKEKFFLIKGEIISQLADDKKFRDSRTFPQSYK